MKKLKTAVIYARYSSDNQTEQSIEGQLHVCQDYAKSNDILILDTYIDRASQGFLLFKDIRKMAFIYRNKCTPKYSKFEIEIYI